ncbi:MAG: hypothetical protein ACREFZ_09510 [Acetobacteraceae bacterium]
MAKEYRISATIPLPDGEIDAAHVMVKLHPVVEAFRKELLTIAEDVDLTHGSVTKRPRKEKAA